MDRRSTPFSGRIALRSLEGLIEAPDFTDGEEASIISPLADLRAQPGGARDRQLLMGDSVLIIERGSLWSFLQSQKDGYCGWVESHHLAPRINASHSVSARLTHLYPEPRVQSEAICHLSFGASVLVADTDKGFAKTARGYIPVCHLKPAQTLFSSPIEVASKFLGTPYLWGGNSATGIDCSGLVQASLLACGIACPGDSDQQAKIGRRLAEDTPDRPGDLLFWAGHVAIVCGPNLLIHANGHSMDVRTEVTSECIGRIAQSGGGPVTARVRYLL